MLVGDLGTPGERKGNIDQGREREREREIERETKGGCDREGEGW